MSEESEKQFEASDQKKSDARKEGRFPRSRDAGGVVALGSVLGVLVGCRGLMLDGVRNLFTMFFNGLGAFERGETEVLARVAVMTFITVALPVGALAAFASMGIGLVQSKMLINFDLVAFKPERLNPMGKLKELLSPKHGVVEVGLAIAKVGGVGFVAYRTFMIEEPLLRTISMFPLTEGIAIITAALGRIVGSVLVTLVVLAAADYGVNYLKLSREMRMSRKEVMDEGKAQEGDQKLKHKMRSKARQNAKKRSIENVKTANVIVTNPTHIAVALRYSDKDSAPTVVAKGHDAFAMIIRAEGRKYGIPIVENRRIARALDAACEVGQPIPAAHFMAVAKILAFVFKLKGRARRAA